VTYGGANNKLVANGAALVAGVSGWHRLTVDTKALTYEIKEYRIGLVGSATPNGWDAPDQKMEYDHATGTWNITIDLVSGDIKFRVNDDWGWNLGGPLDALTVDGSNISVTAGKYTITLTITKPNSVKGEVGGKCTITKK
jgi:hypothetical protein